MSEVQARWMSGDAWALGVCQTIEEVQVRAAERVNGKLAPDIIVMNDKCVPLVSNRTNGQDALPPLVVVVVTPNAGEDPHYREKAVQMHAEVDDWAGVSRALEMMGRHERINMLQEMILRPVPQRMTPRHLIALMEYMLATGSVDINMVGGRLEDQGILECPATLLHIAAAHGHPEVVRALLGNKRIHINAATKWGGTPLLSAAGNGHLEVVQALLGMQGIRINAATPLSWTPLHSAAGNGHLEVVRALLAMGGICINAAINWGSTPLHLAAGFGHLEVVRALLAAEGIQNNAVNTWGQTPLHSAAGEGHLEVVRSLLAMEGVRINTLTNWGQTPLLSAEANGHSEVVQVISDRLAEVPPARIVGGGGARKNKGRKKRRPVLARNNQ